jgi:hypothetical protein
MDKTMVFLVIFAVVAIVYVLYNTVKIEALPLEKGIMYTAGNSMDEPFVNGAPLDYGIGKYSNIELQYNNPNNWRNDTQNIPLLKGKIYAPNGTPFPLKSSDSFQQVYPKMGPYVDGDKNSPQLLSMLGYNQAKPECCPSTFSTSTGCVCLTSKQSDWINSRGNNNSAPSDF